MTQQKKFKDLVRARMQRTGETYTTAKAHLESQVPERASAPDRRLEQGLADRIGAQVAVVMKHVDSKPGPAPLEDMRLLGELGAELHAILTARGHEPKHRKTLVQNRRLAPGTVEFYTHVHAAESLLRFIENPAANDDPVDLTIGSQFKLRVYSRRWSDHQFIHVTRTPTGWDFRYVAEVSAGRDATVAGKEKTGLLELLEQELIEYPAGLPGYFRELWDAAFGGLNHQQVQDAINALGDWVSLCEQSSPSTGPFAHY
jgi:hypothetical protein